MPQEKNPLLNPEYFGSPQPQGNNPLLNNDYFSNVDEEVDELSTAIGRRTYDVRNREQNKERLRNIWQRAKTPEQRDRIQRLIKAMDEDDRDGVAGTASDFARGAAAGLANASLSVGDLALTPADMLGLDAAGKTRRDIQEQKQLVRETVDSKGTAGAVGEFVGELGGAAVPYGMAAGATGRVASKLVPGLAKSIAAGKVSTDVAKRIIANVGENVIGGSIINSLQASGLPDATIKEKLIQLGIGMGADVLFGAGQGMIKPKAKPVVMPPKGATTATPSEIADNLKADGDKRKVQKEAENQIKRLAKAEWQARNPTADWKEVPKDAKEQLYAATRARLEQEGVVLAKKQEEQVVKAPQGEAEGKAPKAPSTRPTPEQVENLRKAGGPDDPFIKETNARTDITGFEKQKLLEQYAKDVKALRKQAGMEKWDDLTEAEKLKKLNDVGLKSQMANDMAKLTEDKLPAIVRGMLDKSKMPKPEAEELPDIPISDDHPELLEENIAKDWDGAVYDASNFPTQRQAIQNYADEAGVPLKKWAELSQFEREQLLNKIRQDRRRELENPIEEIKITDELKDQLGARGVKIPESGTPQDVGSWWKNLRPEERKETLRNLKLPEGLSAIDDFSMLSEARRDAIEDFFTNRTIRSVPNVEQGKTPRWNETTAESIRRDLHREGLNPDEILDQLVNDYTFDAKKALEFIKKNYPNWKPGQSRKGDLELEGNRPGVWDVADWFDSLAPDHKQNVLDNIGVAGVIGPNDGWDKLPKNTRDYIVKQLSNQNKDDLIKPRQFGPTTPDGPVQQPGSNMLRGRGAPPAKQWWERANPKERFMMISEFVQDLREFDPDALAQMEEQFPNVGKQGALWEDLPPELQDHINKRILDIYGEPEVDLGKTVHEPDAARRRALARPTVPNDINDGFVDIIIDGVRTGTDETSFIQQLLRFARENELPDEAVMNSLEDATGWKVEAAGDGWQLTESPLRDASPGATQPEPSLPAPPTGAVPTDVLPTVAGGSPTTPPSALPLKKKDVVVPGQIAAADLSGLTMKQIDTLKEKVFDALDADPDNALLLQDMNALGNITKQLDPKFGFVERPDGSPTEVPIEEAALPPDILVPEAIPPEIAAEIEADAAARNQEHIPFAGQVRPEPQLSDAEFVTRQAIPEEAPLIDPLEYAKLARTSPRKLSDDQLQQMIDATEVRLLSEQSPEYAALMDKLVAEKAARRPPPLQAESPASIGVGATVGYLYGMFTSDDENRQSNALSWALAGAIGGAVGAGVLRQKKPPKPELFPGQSSLPKVISYDSERTGRKINPLAAARRLYAGLVRATAGLEAIYTKTETSSVIPTQANAAKMASIFGRWVAVAERWMTNRPVILGADGEPRYLDAPTLKEVGELVQGDIENLDEVAVALTTLEMVGKTSRLPMDPVRAHMTVSNATPELIEGARQMRKYALALADAMVEAGILAPEVREKFAAEQWYTPLQRVFGDGVTPQQVEQLAKLGDTATSPNPVKGRKGGSTMQVKSPFETLQRMTAQYIRAAEYNKIKQQFVAFARAHPALGLLERVDAKKNPGLGSINLQAMAIKKLVPTIDPGDAARLALALGEEIDPRSPIMTIYEDGVLRSYRIAEPVFSAFKAMLPSEMNLALQLFAVPTQLATRGVVHNPFFIASQFFMDNFQATLMSKYGFRPIIDSVRGWWHVVSRSPEYRRILDLGGPATIQSLSYINPKSSTKAIQSQGSSALETAARQVKELRPIEAYKTLVLPIAEAARVGEALRALDHGESTIEAVYAAWHVTGNTRMQGHFGAIRAFNLLSMFARPAISAMDEAVVKSGLHPFRRPDASKSALANQLRSMGIESDRVINGAEFLTKGFAFIGLPSMYLWFHNLDDEEITQLRQTESGQRYWFFRMPETADKPGTIIKVRKPHVVGQLFGSTLEATLDQMYQRDPENTVRWVGGMVNDAALNILPQFGVIPAALWGNKIPGLDIPIVPESDMKLEPQLMGSPQASNPARVVSSKLSPISNAVPQQMETVRRALSPAGLDYIFSTAAGMLGQDAVQALDVAMNYYDAGLAPANYELPIVGRLFGRYPSMNTRSVRDFYRKAQVVETAALSQVELLKTNPQAAVEYLSRHMNEIALAPTFQSTRQEVANLLRVVEDLRGMLRNKQISQSEFRRVEEEMLRQIIFQTGLANSIANQAIMEKP